MSSYILYVPKSYNVIKIIIISIEIIIITFSFSGLDSSFSLQSKKQSLFARLENIIVTDVDPKTVHKKVCNTEQIVAIIA